MNRFILALAVLVPAGAWAEDDHHLAKIEGFQALHAWTRATTTDEAMIFVELENTGAVPILIQGAEADWAQDAMLVGFQLVNGEPTYAALPAVPIAPGREMHLEPGGLALRLTGLSTDLVEGTELEMHVLTDRGELELHVAVEDAEARQHSHAGHAH